MKRKIPTPAKDITAFFAAVDRKMEAIAESYPQLWKELCTLSSSLTAGEWQDLRALYAGLDCHDLPGADPGRMLSYVRGSRRAQALIPYTSVVPGDLYYDWVLPPRVNNECLDGSREALLDELLPYVQERDILSAALEINCWCAARASYFPTDDRSIAPIGMLRRGYGRCGEESTLLVCALRAAGIPARQCYAPYWAHCDDNHAWVEFWAGDSWHYMGACEPEPVPDLGWFQSAASKALLIRSRVPDPAVPEGHRIVNTTARYGKTALLWVLVTDQGQSVPGATVKFQLINYAQVQTLFTAVTNQEGIASMEAGLGTLLVSTCVKGILVEQAVDLRERQFAELSLDSGFRPAAEERISRWTLTPPKEVIPPPATEDPAHRQRLVSLELQRLAHIAEISNPGNPWLEKARGNWAEIQKFLSLPQYSQEDKALLLTTLTDKDFCDCTCETLESFLAAALPYKPRFPLPVWQWEILAPRVEWEMLLPVRPALQSLLSGKDFADIRQVLSWMERNLIRDPEYGLTDRRGNAAAYVRHGHCPESEWDILAVQICRAFGIPAALSSETGKLPPAEAARKVTLTLPTQEAPMEEHEHFSLSRWNGRDYESVRLNQCSQQSPMHCLLEPGSYSLVTVRRQIDGTVSANAQRFLLRCDRTLQLTPEPDETPQKLLRKPLPPLTLTPLTEIPAQFPPRPSLLLFLQPGQEPTEHLLQELMESAEAFREVPIRFCIHRREDLQNSTLRQALAQLPQSGVFHYREADRYPIQSSAEIGDGRLPLALVLDEAQQIVYGCANYQIRTAARMLRILTIITQT